MQRTYINPYYWVWNLSLSKVEADENERKIGMSWRFGLEIYLLYHEINHLEIKFWVKNTLLASYSRALIALKM